MRRSASTAPDSGPCLNALLLIGLIRFSRVLYIPWIVMHSGPSFDSLASNRALSCQPQISRRKRPPKAAAHALMRTTIERAQLRPAEPPSSSCGSACSQESWGAERTPLKRPPPLGRRKRANGLRGTSRPHRLPTKPGHRSSSQPRCSGAHA